MHGYKSKSKAPSYESTDMVGITKSERSTFSTKQGRQTLIDSFVNAIYLYDDYALVTHNYKDGTIRISLEEIESSDLLSNGVSAGARTRTEGVGGLYGIQFHHGHKKSAESNFLLTALL